MSVEGRRLRVLHVIMAAGETSTQYNEHCLPMAERRELGLCTWFPRRLEVPEAISLFAGDGTPRGFWAALQRALDDRPWDVVHVHAPPLSVFVILAALRRRGLRRRSVYSIHNSFTSYSLRNQLLLLPIVLFFARVLSCSDAVRGSLPSLLRMLAGGRLQVVVNAVDTERVDRVLKDAPPAPGGDFTVASVGRLIEIKEPAVVLRAFHHGAGADARLVFIGDGPLRAHIVEEVARLGLTERVSLTGLVPRDEVYRRLAAADVVVSASKGEGLPIAVLEAMACGVPVVLSDIPPHREVAPGADVTALVAPGDVHGFARQLGALRELPRPERERLGARCRAVVEDRFSLSGMHERLERLYREVADGAGAPRAERL